MPFFFWKIYAWRPFEISSTCKNGDIASYKLNDLSKYTWRKFPNIGQSLLVHIAAKLWHRLRRTKKLVEIVLSKILSEIMLSWIRICEALLWLKNSLLAVFNVSHYTTISLKSLALARLYLLWLQILIHWIGSQLLAAESENRLWWALSFCGPRDTATLGRVSIRFGFAVYPETVPVWRVSAQTIRRSFGLLGDVSPASVLLPNVVVNQLLVFL